MNYINILYLGFLVVIFFVYGLILSEIIDYIFPDFDEEKHEYRMILEIIGEIGIAYLIYFTLQKYAKNFIKTLYNNIIKGNPPFYLDQLLLISFSSGIYKHLQKSTHKVSHIKTKYIDKYFPK